MDARIVQYYKLCTLRMGGRTLVIDQMRGEIEKVLTENEVRMFTRETLDGLTARDNVIGGDGMQKNIVRGSGEKFYSDHFADEIRTARIIVFE